MHILVGLVTVIFLVSAPVYPVLSSEDGGDDSVSEAHVLKGDVDLEDWGIYNGCISSNRIRNIKVLDANSAMLKLVDGKQVKMRFMGLCQGIKQHGFVYTSRNNLFCTHSYSVRVLHTGKHCQVESLEPYLDMKTPDDQDEKIKK